jgi:hypothetical protein
LDKGLPLKSQIMDKKKLDAMITLVVSRNEVVYSMIYD